MDAQTPIADPVLITEAARELGCCTETVRALERAGWLPSRRTRGGVRIFERNDVLRLAEERRVAARSAVGE